MDKTYFVTGIDTNVGKTLVSAALVRYLTADYWKPVQTGIKEGISDSEYVKALCKSSNIFPEQYTFDNPVSPHTAAEQESVSLSVEEFSLPKTDKPLVVEGAGGILCPVSDSSSMLELVKQLKISCIVVVKHYLGSINHSCLTLDILKRSEIPIIGIIWNGKENLSSESFIINRYRVKVIGRLPYLDAITPEQLDANTAHWTI